MGRVELKVLHLTRGCSIWAVVGLGWAGLGWHGVGWGRKGSLECNIIISMGLGAAILRTGMKHIGSTLRWASR